VRITDQKESKKVKREAFAVTIDDDDDDDDDDVLL
jgi:hypothetical protein